MPPRSVSAELEDWRRLAEWVKYERETVLGIGQDEIVRRSDRGISKPVLSIMENARQTNGKMTAKVLRGVSVALGFTPDSAERVLRGEEPVRLEHPGRSYALSYIEGSTTPERISPEEVLKRLTTGLSKEEGRAFLQKMAELIDEARERGEGWDIVLMSPEGPSTKPQPDIEPDAT